MQKHIITKEQLDVDNNYIGKINLDCFDGHLEAEENLGYVKFKLLKVSGYILFKAESGIKAGDGIEAGWGIEAGRGIEAGWGIEAGRGIEAGGGIRAGNGIKAGYGIKAGDGIKAGWGIKTGYGIKATGGIEAGRGIEAGDGIKAGWGIEAGDGIRAGNGIEAVGGIRAGLSISAKFISSKLRIFAGIANWKIATKEEMQVRAELRRGIIAFGELVEHKKG